MKGAAFIKMMREDVETHKDKNVLLGVVALMEHVINLHPGCDIDSKKNVEDCYKKLYEYAKAHQKDKCGIVLPEQSIAIATEYLGLTSTQGTAKPVSGYVDLADFL